MSKFRWWLILALVGCGGKEDSGTDEATTDVDADTDTDTDSDTDTDTDADADPNNDAEMRLINLNSEAPASLYLTPQAQPVLTGLVPFISSPWRVLPSGKMTFQSGPDGGSQADLWAEYSVDLPAKRRFTLAIYGASPDVGMTGYVGDPVSTLSMSSVRFYLHNVATGYPSVDLVNVTDGSTLVAGQAYGADPFVATLPDTAWTLAVDLDTDGTPDVQFDVPATPGGNNVPLYFGVDTATDEAWLVGISPTNVTTVSRVPLDGSGDTGM